MNQDPNKQPKYVIFTPTPKLEGLSPEWALFRFLGEWTPEDMQIAVKKNVDIDLSMAAGFIVDTAIEELLKRFKEQRPDLHAVLNSSEGKSWLRSKVTKALRTQI